MMTRLDKCKACWAPLFAEVKADMAKMKAALAKVEANILKAL
jgi:hypothetical protein